MKTLGQMKEYVAKYAGDSGMCADDERLLPLINEARNILYPLGEWDGTFDPICVSPLYGRLVLPAKYEYAKQAFTCNSRLEVINTWYQRLNEFECYCKGKASLTKEPGRHVTYFDWGKSTDTRVCNPEGFYVMVNFQSDSDVGTVLKFRGIGVRGQTVDITRTLTRENTDIYAAGADQRMVKLTHVIKPRTNSWIKIIAYDGANEFDVALYEGADINPEYTIYRGFCGCQLVMKAKRRYADLLDDDFDEVEFPDQAIVHTLQAIAFREAKNITGFGTELAAAQGYLNKSQSGARATSSLPIRYSGPKVCGLK